MSVNEKKIIFFGNDWCPFCRIVQGILDRKKVNYEYIEIPMNYGKRLQVMYEGIREEIKSQTFGELFGGNITIPKMILSDGKKLYDSNEMVEYLENS